VLQVALYRPDRPNYRLAIDGDAEPLPIEVIQHFRDIDQIQRLAVTVRLRIDIHKDLFQWRPEFRTREDFRKAYFDGAAERIREYSKPVIVFLDPDTGIAPQTYGYEHVTPHEIQTILRAMKPDDVLVFYQAARLGDGDWLNSTKAEFAQAVGASAPVHTITCKEIANDVAFFMVERSRWVDTAPARSPDESAL
jgi:hypothetical protein